MTPSPMPSEERPDPLREALIRGMRDVLTRDWPGDTRQETSPAIVDYLLGLPSVRAALPPDTREAVSEPVDGLRISARELRDALFTLYWGVSDKEGERYLVNPAVHAATAKVLRRPVETDHDVMLRWAQRQSEAVHITEDQR